MSDDAITAGSTPRAARRGKRWRRLAAFTLVIWVVFALLLEGAVRLVVPAPVRAYHRWFGTHLRGGASFRHRSPQDPPEFDQHLTYNHEGFRDVEHPTRKPAGTFRIVVLGDSIVEAREVALEVTFCRLLEAQLNGSRSSAAPRYEVVNCGTSGAGPLLSYLVLRHLPTAHDADLVLMVCFPNDPADDLRYDAPVTRDEHGRPFRVATPRGRLPLPAALKEWLRRHSRAWSYFGSQFVAVGRRLRAQSEHQGAAGRDDFFAVRDDASSQPGQAWQLMRANLGHLDRLAAQRGARFGLVAVPLGHQIRSRPEWEPGRRVHELERGEGAAFQEHLADIARRVDIPYLDLLPPFEDAHEAVLFFPYDGHLTPEGHRLTAQALADWLRQSDLLTASAGRSR